MIYVWTVVIYLLFLVGVSAYRSRQVRTQEDFMVAGRSVSAVFLVGTLVCTWIGSGSLFAGAGRAFRTGLPALWMSAGAWVGIAIVYFLAPRVRHIAEYTVPDILERRYTKWARLLGTLAIVIAYFTIASYQFIGGGRLVNILFPDVPPRVGQLITCAVVVIFIILAGMKSIVTLDLFNGILITGGILVAAPLVLKAAGGWSGLTTTLPETHFTTFGTPGFLPALGLFFPTFFLLLGESGMYQKFMSAKSEATARRAVIGMIVGVIIVETVLDLTAVFGAGIYWNDPAYMAGGEFNQRVTETIILQVARHNLPTIAGILLLVGGVAIIVSTATTFLMVPSTNLARDIFQRFIKPDANEKQVVLFQRIMILVLAGLSLLITTQFESILDMALYAYTMVGAAVTPALLAAFLWRRVTPLAGTLSVGGGMLVTFIYGVLNFFGLSNLDYDYIIYPAGGVSILLLIVVSLLQQPPPEEQWKPFWEKPSTTYADLT